MAVLIGLTSGCDRMPPLESRGAVATKAQVEAEVKSDSASDLGVSLMVSFPSPYDQLPRKNGGLCEFDLPKVDRDTQFLSGWVLTSSESPRVADSLVIGIAVDGVEKFAVPNKVERVDVVDYFKNSKLKNSGFSVYLKKSDALVASKAKIYFIDGGKVYICATTSIS